MNNINNHRLEIIINGVPIDLFSEGINLRMNNVITDPSKITTTQATYSFSFNIPITPLNSKVFNYINASSRPNKFSGRYQAEVYADEIRIFEGTLKVSSIEDNMFKCNLYQNKVNTIETIFGETTMSEINWYVPFKGIDTINEVNNDITTKYYFPLVAYSLFNKVPEVTTQSGYRKYTDKYLIDNTNRFYYNSFVPSLNLVELLKKCCELKGYQLQGDIIADKIMNEIYLSNYIADGQDPLYNYGDTDMGEVSFDFSFKNYSDGGRFNNSYLDYTLTNPIPYPSVKYNYENYTNVNVYNLLDETFSTISNITNESKLLVNGGVQIPADGWYEITLNSTFGVPNNQGSIVAELCTGFERNSANGNAPKVYEDVTVEYGLEQMPLEIQLLKYNASDSDIDSLSHDLIYKGEFPNEYAPDGIKRSAIRSASRSEGTTVTTTSNRRPSGSLRYPTTYTYTNITSTTEGQSVVTAVDPYNNPNFVCGLSQSQWSRSLGYIKNGYSWNYDDGTTNNALYNCAGYYYYDYENNTYVQTQVNENVLPDASNDLITVNGRFATGTNRIIIRLNKNDMLVPFIQNRAYYDSSGNTVNYMIEASGNLTLRAVAPIDTPISKLSYSMESLFDKELNLGNFNNNEQKISDFFNDVIKAFNLNASQVNKTIVLNKNKVDDKYSVPIDIDYKTNTSDALYNELEIPRSIEVKYKIDTEEEGFYRSVEDNTTEEQMQSNNWKDYGDYGYSKVILSQTDDSTDLSQSLNFSYNWNRPFRITQNEQSASVDLPVIGKTVWWIDGLDYEGYAKNDGRGLTQRMWFRVLPQGVTVSVDDENVDISTCINYKIIDDTLIDLSYKNKDNTLLTKYFNVRINGRNGEVEIEAYLNPMEYKAISNGATIHFDDDLFKPIEIEGYDPSGINATKIKMMKL